MPGCDGRKFHAKCKTSLFFKALDSCVFCVCKKTRHPDFPGRPAHGKNGVGHDIQIQQSCPPPFFFCLPGVPGELPFVARIDAGRQRSVKMCLTFLLAPSLRRANAACACTSRMVLSSQSQGLEFVKQSAAMERASRTDNDNIKREIQGMQAPH
jgi:hypothetical protein